MKATVADPISLIADVFKQFQVRKSLAVQAVHLVHSGPD